MLKRMLGLMGVCLIMLGVVMVGGAGTAKAANDHLTGTEPKTVIVKGYVAFYKVSTSTLILNQLDNKLQFAVQIVPETVIRRDGQEIRPDEMQSGELATIYGLFNTQGQFVAASIELGEGPILSSQALSDPLF